MINLEEYPKSKEKLFKFCENWLLALQEILLKGVSGERPPLEPDLIEMQALNIINNNRRVLYDFFDKENIKMGITAGDKFIWHISAISTLFSETSYDNRLEAEEKGFEQCFKILENGI